MNRDEIAGKFLDAIEFDLYPYQEEAILAWFETDDGLLITVPTGMGKTLLAEAAVFEALHSRRLYYTTPLIALTDQKFREMQDKAESWGFAREDVGLITGNRRENPDAPVLIVVAEILLNHLLATDDRLQDVGAVVMDEFHYFNDRERGIVWELSLGLLPQHVRLMLLSATVGNAYEFTRWLATQHGRDLRLISSDERRVPLEYHWVGDKLLTEHLPTMLSDDDDASRAPALVFCFNRNECWEIAERLKGVKLIPAATRDQIEQSFDREEFSQGIGPKLRQMLIRGVGVHHAGILPKHKVVIEDLFGQKLVPFVICTETLAAGINLPARSVVIGSLMKGKPGEKKLVAPSSAHQMFGRAGRPQFDTHGYVYAVAHEDDAKIAKWRAKYDQLDPRSKDPGIMRARKQLERKKPTRRKTVQYWTEGQFQTLIRSGPANLYSQSMIPYQFLIFMLTKTGTLDEVREFLSRRFNSPERIAKWQDQFALMIDNLAALGYLAKQEDADHITLNDSIFDLVIFRSVDPLYGAFLCEQLAQSNLDEKIQALESVLDVSPSILRQVRLPDDLPPGPLFENVIKPQMIAMGVTVARPEKTQDELQHERMWGWSDDENERPPTFPEMLKIAFDAKLPAPEDIRVQSKWVLGALRDLDCDFFKFVTSHDLTKHEGIILRHLLRLVILAGEFFVRTEDPDYQQIGELATRTCQRVDPRYTDRFLAEQQDKAALISSS
ncbi:MAG: DEAD/DEAH box helicase [Phycisphaerales bacterium]|nr:MAG: DEAD/DEAH box helicase [Phycisphaerales bacterium]